MAKAGNNPKLIVRPRGSWRAHKTFYAFVAVMTAIMVYQWGWNKTRRSVPTDNYTATASVWHQSESSGGSPGGAEAGAGVDFVAIQQHIADTENVRRAILAADGSLSALPPQDRQAVVRLTVEEVCRNLHVSCNPTAAPRGVRIGFQCTAHDPAFVVALVNVFAGQYAQDCRTEWKAGTQEAYQAACEASQRARRNSSGAKERLENLLAQIAERERQNTEAAEAAEAVKPTESPSPSTKPAPQEPVAIDNPDWVNLSEELTELEQNRAALLVTRTPLHPAVIDVEDRIGEAKRRLAAMSPTIAAPSSNVTSKAGATQPPQTAASPKLPAKRPVPIDPEEQAKLAATLHKLRGEMYRAEEAQEAAQQAERQAMAACQQPLRLEIDLANPIEPAMPLPGLRVVLAAMTSALTVLGGLMMVVAGVVMEPRLGTVEEVEAMLPVPVVGTLPAGGSRLPGGADRQRLVRAALVGAGMILIATCLGIAWMFV
jgi:hypothetical protein